MNKTFQLDSLSHFWICFDENKMIISTSDYFTKKLKVGGSLFESINFFRPSLIDNFNNMELMKSSLVNFSVTALDFKFRGTIHECQNTDQKQYLIVAWPSLNEFSDIKTFDLQELVKHPGCYVLDHLMIKDILVREHDLNAKMQADQLVSEKMAKLQEDFISNLSHEIRSPLSVLLGTIDLIKNAKGKSFSDCLEKIDSVGWHLNDLVCDILDLNKLDRAMMEVKNEEFDLRQTLDEIVAMNGPIDQEIEVRTRYETATRYITCDKIRFKQILQNLLSNAFKFVIQRGQVHIDVYESKSELCISVFNDGREIKKDEVELIFSRFVQLNNSNDEVKKGTGIGMPLSKGLAKLLGGDLVIDTEASEGARFILKLNNNCISQGETLRGPMFQNRELWSVPVDELKVLIIDDSEDNVHILQFYLSSFNQVNVSYELDAIAGLEQFRNQKFDVIFLDMNMPKMSGIQLIQKIREIETLEHRDKTFVTAFTANAFEMHSQQMLSNGCDFFLTKPISKVRLSQFMNRFYKEVA